MNARDEMTISGTVMRHEHLRQPAAGALDRATPASLRSRASSRSTLRLRSRWRSSQQADDIAAIAGDTAPRRTGNT